MKRKLNVALLLCALLALSLPTTAQVEKDIKLGVTLGGNYSRLGGERAANFNKAEYRPGWYAGPKIEVKFKPINMGFDASIEYSQYRINRQYTAPSADGNVNKNRSDVYQTIEIPLNYRYTYQFMKILDGFAFTGPQFGVNIGNGRFYDEGGYYHFNRMRYSWNFGVGVTVIKNIQVAAAYNLGLGKIGEYKGDHSLNYPTCKTKLRNFRVEVSYLFELKKKKAEGEEEDLGL